MPEPATDTMSVLRAAATPVYMPLWLRVPAIVLGVLILSPPLIHSILDIWIRVMGLTQPLHEGSDGWRLGQIVLGAGICFPDPVIGMIRAWRAK